MKKLTVFLGIWSIAIGISGGAANGQSTFTTEFPYYPDNLSLLQEVADQGTAPRFLHDTATRVLADRVIWRADSDVFLDRCRTLKPETRLRVGQKIVDDAERAERVLMTDIEVSMAKLVTVQDISGYERLTFKDSIRGTDHREAAFENPHEGRRARVQTAIREVREPFALAVAKLREATMVTSDDPSQLCTAVSTLRGAARTLGDAIPVIVGDFLGKTLRRCDDFKCTVEAIAPGSRGSWVESVAAP
ncbi:MAG: hypothetical protein HY459_02455 [Parcubacteria group bacterium]|nr:hypothetical protein [Parcubacteria group bacterium]